MPNNSSLHSPRRIALIGTYVPRQCGIATFTDDLYRALRKHDNRLEVSVIAMNDRAAAYTYPVNVAFEIEQDDTESYAVAADFLNVADPDLICLQHEFGIYGGSAGEHLLRLLRGVTAPVITTLHTILEHPDDHQRMVMDALIERSWRLVVMAEKGRTILEDVYDVPSEKIAIIPHGVPDRAFLDPAFAKHALDLADRTLLMTFGLLGPGKGIETAIQALPALIKSHPKILYMVIGATHPNLVHREGERYRMGLIDLARSLGVSDHVRFVDRFCSLDELLEQLDACDIYLSPYPNEAQIVSGTLAYALALGKAVVSTPFWYAREMLADDRGLMAPFGQPDAFASAIRRLIEDDKLRSSVRTKAYEQGRSMIWPRVAERYIELFNQLENAERAQSADIINFPRLDTTALPEISTIHLAALTDDVGLFQHAKFGVAHRRHGYCLDDNARALLVMAELAMHRKWTPEEERLSQIYASFVDDAFCHETGQVRNFMRFDRRWIADPSLAGDSLGRAVWALGNVGILGNQQGLSNWAAAQLLEILPLLPDCGAPRAWAYGLLGISAFLKRFPGHRYCDAVRSELAQRLLKLQRDISGPGWFWFEDRLGYDNARLCEALIVCGQDTEDVAMLETGIETLRWLMEVQCAPAGHFRPVGTQSFGIDRSLPRPFDQQPLEVWSAVNACLAAATVSETAFWWQEAQRAFAWFLGGNDLKLPVVDPDRGASFDGLHPDRRNANQGAESTLAYLAALTALKRFQQQAGYAELSSRSIITEVETRPRQRMAAS